MTAFCVTIVKNTSIDMLRQIQQNVHIDYWDSILDENADDVANECICNADVHKLTEVINLLTIEERHFIYLRYTMEMGYKEIGELLNISEDTAKKRGQRLIKKSESNMRGGNDMEKKWQAMLHEAADASFQKEIEVLAVMDSAAYSYVDLPQTALCTLSERDFIIAASGDCLTI